MVSKINLVVQLPCARYSNARYQVFPCLCNIIRHFMPTSIVIFMAHQLYRQIIPEPHMPYACSSPVASPILPPLPCTSFLCKVRTYDLCVHTHTSPIEAAYSSYQQCGFSPATFEWLWLTCVHIAHTVQYDKLHPDINFCARQAMTYMHIGTIEYQHNKLSQNSCSGSCFVLLVYEASYS